MEQADKIQTLQARGITKRFPGVLANDQIDFEVREGEIHALLGENGAGKSTLMKVLYGMYSPDSGSIIINGDPVRFHSPLDAISRGIGMVHQHFMLVDTLSVVENMALGLSSSRKVFLDLDRVTVRLEELASLYHFEVDPAALVWQLSVGERQRVEILKVLYRGTSTLILDEPTAVLTPQEVDRLFVILRRMVDEGYSIIFISHKLNEVMALSDLVTVLRDGRVVGNVKTAQTTLEELAGMMVGRKVSLKADYHLKTSLGKVGLRLEGVQADGDGGIKALKGINLDVYEGEIFAVAGVSGNGQKELAEVIAGLRPTTAGRIILKGKDITNYSPRSRIEEGLSYIPEERMMEGVVQEFSIEDNVILKDYGNPKFTNWIFIRFREISRITRQLIERFRIKAPSTKTPVQNLSGGNIQKVILARELSRRPSVLVASQPTRGIDFNSTTFVREQIAEQRLNGATTLLISEDLDEVLSLADRIAVMYEGELMGVVTRAAATIQKLGMMMGGARLEQLTGES